MIISSGDSKQSDEVVKNLVELLLSSVQLQGKTLSSMVGLKDLLLDFQTKQIQQSHPNPLNRFGLKCFSQTDEDGITLEILRRLDIEKGSFAEFGVGNGLENNTLILAAMGWKGFWVGGEDLAFSCSSSNNFNYMKTWITKENIVQCARSGMESVSVNSLDVVSLDLDGNDIYFVAELLENSVRPKLFIVEYNAQFIPPARFQIAYDPLHCWKGDNYFGAALSNFNDVFEQHGYRLVCCNSHTGANAFFVRREFDCLFSDVPLDIREIYSPPRYHLYSNYGHRQSVKTVEKIIADLNFS